MERTQFYYRVRLDSMADIMEFTKIAERCRGQVTLVNGHHRLSAKSFLSVVLAKISWDEIRIEADYDCYFDFEKFIQ